MGYDAGPDPDTSGTSAVRLCDEYPAKRQPDKDRSGSTGVYDCRGNYECDFLYLYEQEKGTVIFLQVKNAKQMQNKNPDFLAKWKLVCYTFNRK